MTHFELVHTIAKRRRLSRQLVRQVIATFTDEVANAVWLFGHHTVPGLASFRVIKRKSRRIANPSTGEPMTLPATRAVGARVSSKWRTKGT